MNSLKPTNEKLCESRDRPMPINKIFELTSQCGWNEYVLQHPQGSIFHTREMYQVFANTPRHEPMFNGYRDSTGKIIAMLCAVKIDTIGGAMSSLASRSVMFAEPICDDSDEGIMALKKLIEHHDLEWGRKTLFTEIRLHNAPGAERIALEGCGYDHLEYLNYVNDLSDGQHVLASKIKKTFRKIRTARRRGMTVDQASTPDMLLRVYRQIQSSYSRAKVPVAPLQLFESAVQFLPNDSIQLRVGSLDGTDVASAVGLIFKDRYYAWYNGTTRPQGVSATATVVWDEIEAACRLGLTQYDFGGAGWPDEDFGPRKFKSRFGGELVSHGRYRKVGSPLKLALAKGGYGLFRTFLANRSDLECLKVQLAKDRE